MDKTEELHIIRRIRLGDKEAYRLLVDAYSSPVFVFIRDIVESREDAEDLAQEVFIKAFFSLEKYRGDASFFSWIYRIAYNESISFLRKKKRKGEFRFIENADYALLPAELTEDDQESSIGEKREQEIRYESLGRALRELDTEERFLLHAFYFKKNGIRELSDITGLSESNIKVKLFRIKKRLSRMIQKEGRP